MTTPSDRSDRWDVVVVGGGISGVAIAYELSRDRRVLVLDKEGTLAFHTTGRSAAMFLETYGGPDVRALTTASRADFTDPSVPVQAPLLTPRAMVQIARHGSAAALHSLCNDILPLVPDARMLAAQELSDLHPMVRPDRVELAMIEPSASEIDVTGLHQGYVQALRANGGEVRCRAEVSVLRWGGGEWEVTLAGGGVLHAATVVNAAGAWADDLARLAGLRPVGLTPMNRTIFMTRSPVGSASKNYPMLNDIDETFYLKPEGGQFLCSPADETPTPAQDAKPDELVIAKAIDAINDMTTLNIRSVSTSWAGQRTFARDRSFVLGADPGHQSFIWHAGQGGYGIQTAPAAARLAAALVRGEHIPADLLDRGLDHTRLTPARFAPGLQA